jgi:general secretion pathway protein M
MILPVRADRTTAVVGLSLFCLLTLVLYAIGNFWLIRQEYAGEIDNITPRTARLLGFIQSEEQLAAAARRIDQVLEEVAYFEGKDSAMTAASMQQKVREVMAAAGLSVSGSQILPSRKIEGFEQLNLNITVEGNIGSLDEAIGNLRVLRPLVLIQSVNIKPLRIRRPRRGVEQAPELEDQRKLSVRFHLLSLRLPR